MSDMKTCKQNSNYREGRGRNSSPSFLFSDPSRSAHRRRNPEIRDSSWRRSCWHTHETASSLILNLRGIVSIAESLEVTADELLVGNQRSRSDDYIRDISKLLEDCSIFEKKVIYGLAREARRLLRDGKALYN